jgi:hypothetical protein
MKRLACLALPLLLCACGATKIRDESPSLANWSDLRVKVQGQNPDATAQLQDELKRTGLFSAFVTGPDAPADLVISAVDEKVVGETSGPFCFNYAFSYLTAGIVPEVCDQKYEVDIDVTAPATGRAAQFRAELTQRRFIGLFGLISSAFGDWKFFGPQAGNPVLARGALLDQKGQIDGLLKQ